MKKHVYLLVLIFAFACVLRLYPVLISGLPFSTDGWSLIRNSELLLKYTPVSFSDSLFDDYNSFWPASSIFGAVVSEVTCLPPVQVMAFFIPFAGAMVVPLFFLLVSRITGKVQVALFSSVLVSTIYPYVLFTSGVTKETFANPIFYGLVLLFLMQPSVARNLLFAVASVALVLTHHLTAFIALAVLACLTLGLHLSEKDGMVFSVKSGLFMILFFGAVLLGYFGFYAHAGLIYVFTASDFLTAGAYQILVFSLVLFFVLRPTSSRVPFLFKKRFILSVATLVLAFLLVVFVTEQSIVAGAPVLPFHYLLYLSPYFVLIPLLFFCFNRFGERTRWLLAPIFWLVPLVGLECYAIFGNSPLGLTLIVRLVNFLIIPLCILFGLAFDKIHAFFKGTSKQKIVTVGVIATLLSVSCVNCYSVYASVSLQEPYMGYFWFYRQPEDAACNWISTFTTTDQTVAGDVKVFYFLRDYYNVSVDVSSGLNFLGSDGSAPNLLLVYSEMPKNGYVVYGGYALQLPDNYSDKLSELNHVYSNNLVNLYGS